MVHAFQTNELNTNKCLNVAGKKICIKAKMPFGQYGK